MTKDYPAIPYKLPTNSTTHERTARMIRLIRVAKAAGGSGVAVGSLSGQVTAATVAPAVSGRVCVNVTMGADSGVTVLVAGPGVTDRVGRLR